MLIFPQKKHGVLAKIQSTGPFAEEWKEAFGKIASDAEEVDVTNAISSVALSVKDERELVLQRINDWSGLS